MLSGEQLDEGRISMMGDSFLPPDKRHAGGDSPHDPRPKRAGASGLDIGGKYKRFHHSSASQLSPNPGTGAAERTAFPY